MSLDEMLNWPLEQKVDHTLEVMEVFMSRLEGKVYVSFSGGKDSTVLMFLARMLNPDILGVFCNTGCEDPSIIRFVNEKKDEGWNITTIRPKKTPREVWAKYGFPLVSKEQAEMIYSVRYNPNSVRAQKALNHEIFGIKKKWRFLIDEPFCTNSWCCEVLKKAPFHHFEMQTGLSPILGIMASESRLRRNTYLRQGGCNVFSETDSGRNYSHPLSIWTDDDIFNFVRKNNLAIADIYKSQKRSGCVACGFGAQFADDTRFQYLYEHHPKYYQMVMNFQNNGVLYRDALRKVLSVNGLKLPDED